MSENVNHHLINSISHINFAQRLITSQSEGAPIQQRLAIVENWKLRIIHDDTSYQSILNAFTNFSDSNIHTINNLRIEKREYFEKKLDHLINKSSFGNTYEYPLIGEDLFTVNDLNSSLTTIEQDHLQLPQFIDGEELKRLSLMRYVFESNVFDNITAGYMETVMRMWHKKEIPESNLFCLLRDGRVFYSTALGLANQNSHYEIRQENGKIRQAHINRAIVAPLAHERESVDYSGELLISKSEALAYLQNLQITNTENTKPLSIFLDTGSLGSLLRALKEGVCETGDISAIYLTAENPKIPAYIPYLSTGSWSVNKTNHELRRKQQIVRDYAEDHFGAYSYRPEQFKEHKDMNNLILPVKLPNYSTSILSWASLVAAKDTGEIYGMMRKVEDMSVEDLPRQTLDTLYEWWKRSNEDPTIPNIGFMNWGLWDEQDTFLKNWPDNILYELGLK